MAAVLLLLTITAASCGGSDEPQREVTPTIPDGATVETPAQQPTVPATAAGAATATAPPPTPTTAPPTVTPPPTPAEIIFSRAQAGNGSARGRNTGIFGIVFADSGWDVTLNSNRVQAFAFVNAGISEEPSASAWISNDFNAPDTGAGTVQAQVSANIRWQGVLAGNGLGGTRAAVDITLSILDGNRTIASHPVHSNEVRESTLTLGGFDDVGSTAANFTANLVPGRRYRIQLRVDCEARSGILSASTHCVFGQSDTYDTGFVEWSSLSILFS